MTQGLARVASSVASNPTAAASLDAGENGQRALFDLLRDARLGRGSTRDVAITIYDARGAARAWAGRPSDLPQDRISGAADFFVTPSPLGLRLVYVQPILAPPARRVGSVAAENILSPTPAGASMAPVEFTLSNPIAPVSLRTRYEGAGDNVTDGAFLLRAPDGDAVAEAAVPPGACDARADAWRAMVHAQALAAGGDHSSPPDRPASRSPDRPRREARRFVTDTLLASALLVGGALALWTSFGLVGGTPSSMPGNLMLGGATAAALAALWAAGVAGLRLRFRKHRRAASDSVISLLVVQLGCRRSSSRSCSWQSSDCSTAIVQSSSSIDLRHFSFHPWNGSRLALVRRPPGVHLAALWTATLIFVAAPSRWRLSRSAGHCDSCCWPAGCFRRLLPSRSCSARDARVPPLGLLLSGVTCGVAALVGRRIADAGTGTRQPLRESCRSSCAFLIPALLLYPSINFLAERATRRLITTQYSVRGAEPRDASARI